MIKELIEMLKIDEGTGPVKDGRMFSYRDSVGLLTIGYGRNIEERGISFEEAEEMLNNDIIDSLKECHDFEWFVALNEPRQAVICNMVFNMGISRFKGFKKTIEYIEAGNYVEASIEMLDSKWADQTGIRAVRLSDIMRSGEFNE